MAERLPTPATRIEDDYRFNASASEMPWKGSGINPSDRFESNLLNESYSGMYPARYQTPSLPSPAGSSSPTPAVGDGQFKMVWNPKGGPSGTGAWEPEATTTRVKENPIKGLITDALSTIGESSTASGVVESQRFPQQVADWKNMGQRYALNPNSDVRPDLQGYLDAAPSKLESIQEGTKFNKENVAGYALNPMQLSMRPALKYGGENRLANWASFVSSKGLERGLGLGGSYTELLKNWFGGSSGVSSAASTGGGIASGVSGAANAAGSSTSGIQSGVSATTGAASSAGSSGGGGFSLGPWGYIAGAVIGVIEGIWQWADAEKQDEAMKKQARDEYEAAVKVWESNQNKQRAANRIGLAQKEKAERETVQARAAQGNMTKKQNFMNLISMASGPRRQYQTPQLGR